MLRKATPTILIWGDFEPKQDMSDLLMKMEERKGKLIHSKLRIRI